MGIFQELFYRPLLNLLFFIYNLGVVDLGVAIIILTIVVRLVLLPLFYKSAKDQTILQKIYPKIQEAQKKHKDDKERQVQEIMGIYREHKVNPFSGFLLLLVQLPILIGLYQVFLKGFSAETLTHLYAFVSTPLVVNTSFLGLVPLDQNNIILVFLAGIFQYLQSYILLRVNKKNNSGPAMVQNITRKMVFFAPLLTIVILYSLPSAVALYWLTTSVFSVGQQLVINKNIHKEDGTHNGSDAERT